MAKHFVSSAVFIILIAFVNLKQTQATISDENALTFKWYDDVTAAKVQIAAADKIANPEKHLGEQLSLYSEVNGTYKLGATDFSSEFPDSISWTKTAGFVDTVFYGYQQHHNVIIRPDDIWTAIQIQFSLYVNSRAEALRHSFVNFDGKENLRVKFRARVDEVPIGNFISKILKLIRKNIDPAVFDWISPNFTTTTENDKLTAGVAMMATLQTYFDYEFWGIICGIPKATILGTVDDWKVIRERVKKLNDYELRGESVMAQWSSMLGRILDQFVSVKEGNPPNSEFWKQAIRIDYKLIDLVCAKVNETYINGWMTAFTAFTLGGRWRGPDTVDSNQTAPWLKIRTDKITPGVVHVPIKIYDEFAKEGERNYNGTIISGHMGYSVKRDEKTLQPFSGWIMTITNTPPEYIRDKIRSG